MPVSSPRGPSRRAWVLGTLAIAAGVALAIWFGLAASLGHVTWQDTAYHVDSDRLVQVGYSVHRAPGRAVVCTIQAQDVHHATVGTTQDRIPASGDATVQRVVQVHTTTRAVTGTVQTCDYAGSSRSS
ncbi:MAG TPA: DUF4307 domain-containing protein [Segeticoccus sp.]|uniref:DUF4307 domain-containing protein n=1 Tax=Segeticoccus sp. TaxID=2706531 RepID=UPI002D7E6934|nr:DUF4307 domain-containing protein [Segeticoccus sp.]HET8599406.1 DUF4307 domain-containing protein [Segeticoccus sp.]